MRLAIVVLIAGLSLLFAAPRGHGEEVLFEDSFEKGLSEKWQVVGLKAEDYRVREGALEMRVQPGKPEAKEAMLKVVLPFGPADSVSCSVKVTLIDDFKAEREYAGISLVDESGSEFTAKQQLVGGKLVFAPGKYIFKGLPGERGDPAKYDVEYTAATRDAGPLRIIADRSNAFFQVGPSADDKYLNFFHSAIRKDTKERGFALIAHGAPEKAEHWVRFDDFRVIKH